MQKLEYYDRQKKPWIDIELEQIRHEYENDKMTISQIGDIHHRTPGSISFKLQNLGLIKHNALARGYPEYKNSKLYKEIVENGNDYSNKTPKNRKKDPIIEINEMRHDINLIKKDIQKILRVINAIYEFETQ